VAEVATDLGCDWHTVMDAVLVYGQPLIDDPLTRIGPVEAVGIDETLARQGRYRRQLWSTQIVDVRSGQLLDVVADRPQAWCDQIAGTGSHVWLRALGNDTAGDAASLAADRFRLDIRPAPRSISMSGRPRSSTIGAKTDCRSKTGTGAERGDRPQIRLSSGRAARLATTLGAGLPALAVPRSPHFASAH
jgi:hypothetical protein